MDKKYSSRMKMGTGHLQIKNHREKLDVYKLRTIDYKQRIKTLKGN